MEAQVYEYWLNSIPGLGWKRIQKLLEYWGSAEAVYQAKAEYLEKFLPQKLLEALTGSRAKWDLAGEYEKLAEKEIVFLAITSPEYPRRLKEIPDPPYGIFYKGRLPREEVLSVAVIGARECSEYGKYVAMALGKAFAQKNVQVISGMARGIDGISQRAALYAGGNSFAVLGCGVDICYPAQNRELYEQLIHQGGILSSYPPGTAPQPSLFPPRNRIVSGLADALIVVEARQKSGTLITVDMALEQGREVYVVPGRLTDRLSDGCNRLLKQGAGIVLSPDSFLEEMGQLFPDKCGNAADYSYPVENRCRTENQSMAVGGNPAESPSATEGCYATESQSITKDCHITERRNVAEEYNAIEGCNTTEEGSYPTPQPSMEARLLACLDYYPRSVEQIRGLLDPPINYQDALKLLMKLCLTGQVLQAGAGYFQLGGNL